MTGAALFSQFERTGLPPTPPAELDRFLAELRGNAAAWAATPIERRIELLERVMVDVEASAEGWVRDACAAKGIDFESSLSAEEWWPGPVLVLRAARLLRDSLIAISKGGMPNSKGKVEQRTDGQTVVKVFPTNAIEKVLFAGMTAEVWMEPGITPDDLPAYQASGYQAWESPTGAVSVVLGAGNVASIGPMDVLTEIFARHRVVCLKMNPVNEYLGPHFESALGALIEAGLLRIAYGGSETGKYLTTHEEVDAIHITGSDKSYDAIVFGVGEDGARRKAEDDPINTRPITSELSNVSPVIVVPGPWSKADLAYQGRHIAGSLINNAGFNCNATRVIVTHHEWLHRQTFIDEISKALADAPDRNPYYPGAVVQWQEFLKEHPDARVLGEIGDHCVPWTLIDGLSRHAEDEICFSVESFNGVTSEVALDGVKDVGSFIREAVAFCNTRLWGSLNATILIHPKTLRDPEVVLALDQAIADLEYGSIGINVWSALSYALVSTTWGAFPGHARNDIRSGSGFVHNAYLYDRPQKSVVRAPFKAVPEPLWHSGQKSGHIVSQRLLAYELEPSWKAVPGIVAGALRG